MTAPTLIHAGALLRRGHKVGLATVLSTQGSVPGRVGARLLISSEGVVGTIGGAGLERTVIARLEELLDSERPVGEVHTYGLHARAKGFEVRPLDSLCGGQVTVSLEVVIPMPHLLLMGGGHCARAIAEVTKVLGWQCSVTDSREAYSTLDGSEEGLHMTPEVFFESEDGTSLARFSDILLLGHDWKEDETRLIGLLSSGYGGRIGVIGSRSKWQAFEAAALEQGIAPADLDEVTCPIGVNIGAESPEEIAIAVAAWIISRRTGTQPATPTWRDERPPQ